LPGPVACAILPHTRHSRALAKQAHKSGKEILLHLPMQSSKGREPGPGKLVSGMPSLELALTVRYNLENVPYAVGINNHMGSELTQDKQAMRQLMLAMKLYPKLFFVDSVTSRHSVASKIARQYHIPNLSRDIFLDNERSTAAIDAQIHKLVRLAKKRGYALAIGHPYPVTLSALEKWLPILDTYQVKLVPLSTLISLRQREQTP
jgi:uncharacterized protein